jgi:glutaredoxin-like protein
MTNSAPLLPESITAQVRELFGQLQNPVQLILFTEQEHCQYCGEALQLLEEVAALSEHISVEVFDITENAAQAAQYRVDKTPTIIVAARDGEKITDYSIRFVGIPSGHEFTTLIQDILLVSRRDSGLSEEMRAYVRALQNPLHLQVFVTPT